jgi:UDP-N-acetylmuramate dehydrogenase
MRESVQAPLAGLTTMRVGGPARRLVEVETTDELVDVVREVDDADEPLLVLGGGSNLVIADAGFDGTVVRVATRGVSIESVDYCGGALVRVAAGEVWDDLVVRSVEEGWTGIEALSGIPGSVGATPVQNVGAYGQEIASTLAAVRVWDRHDQQVRTIANADCGFGYRTSVFKTSTLRGAGRYVVLDATYQLVVGDLSAPVGYADLARQLDVPLGARVPLAQAREAVLAQRRLRGMVLDPADHDTWSCGSFFTNPVMSAEALAVLRARVGEVVGEAAAERLPEFADGEGRVKTSAAWLIEQAGFGKGFGSPGPAAVSTKHSLAVTNLGGALAADIVDLARRIRDGVAERFGVELVNEPQLIGESLS